MDNAFLGPLLSAFGRSFLSKRNRGKSTGKKNIHRMGFFAGCRLGFFIASIVALIIFIVDFSRGWLNSGGIIAFYCGRIGYHFLVVYCFMCGIGMRMWRLRVRMCCGVLFSGLLKRLISSYS